ncbi:hypothetical protein ABZ891_09240 [Streptomyces sp. NPDC047023]|uniref:hypothetical protein n=1 Tax=Streptomyces sp. NPDC047023 TaxID=3155139 RepID=UPI0033F401B0
MSPETIPEEIARGAIQRAHNREEAAREARRNPRAVALRISLAAEEAGLKDVVSKDGKSVLSKERQYIDRLVVDQAKLTPPEGAKPISAFWTFGVEHPDAPLNGWKEPVHFLSQRFVSEEWAAEQNAVQPGSAQTLETTRGGHELDDMFLWEPEVIRVLGGARRGFHPEYAEQAWGQISKTYAGLAEGRVIVFGQDANTRSILHQQESGQLCNNPNVGLHNIEFAYEADQNWPEVTRNEAGTNEVRAVAQYDNPALPRYIDPKGFAELSPEERKAKIDAIIEEVAPGQGAAEAVEAPEQQASPKALPTPLWQLGFKQTETIKPATTPEPAAVGGPSAAPPEVGRQSAPGMEGP